MTTPVPENDAGGYDVIAENEVLKDCRPMPDSKEISHSVEKVDSGLEDGKSSDSSQVMADSEEMTAIGLEDDSEDEAILCRRKKMHSRSIIDDDDDDDDEEDEEGDDKKEKEPSTQTKQKNMKTADDVLNAIFDSESEEDNKEKASNKSDNSDDEVLTMSSRKKKSRIKHLVDEDDDQSSASNKSDNSDGEVRTMSSRKKKSRIKSLFDEDDDQSSGLPSLNTEVEKPSQIKFSTDLFDESDGDGSKSGRSSGSGSGSDSGSDDNEYRKLTSSEQPPADEGFGADDSDSDYEKSRNLSSKLKARLAKGAAKKAPHESKKRAAKDCAMEVHSESQRLVRDSLVSLPYHQPTPKPLQDFLSRANEKKSAIKTLRGPAGYRSLLWFEQQERKKQEKIAQDALESSDSPNISKLDSPNISNVDSANISNGDSANISNTDSSSVIIADSRQILTISDSASEQPSKVDVAERLKLHIHEDRDELQQNITKRLEEEDFDALPDLVIETENPTLNDEDSHLRTTDDVAAESSLCKSDNRETSHSDNTKILDESVVMSEKTCSLLNSDDDKYSEDSPCVWNLIADDDDQPTVSAPIDVCDNLILDIPNNSQTNNCYVMEVDSHITRVLSTPVATMNKADNSITPSAASGESLSTPATSSRKAALLKQLGNLENVTPKLIGDSNSVIELEEAGSMTITPQNPGILKLASRFLEHSKKKKKSPSKDININIVQKNKEEGEKEELILSTLTYHPEHDDDDENSMSKLTKPGAKLSYLKEHLQAQMKQRREEARLKRVELYELDNEEGYEAEGEEEDEAEMSEGEDTDVEDDEFEEEVDEEYEDDEAAEKEKNPFVDGEAEEDDDDGYDDDAYPKKVKDNNLMDDEDDGVSLKLDVSDDEEDEKKDDYGDDDNDELDRTKTKIQDKDQSGIDHITPKHDIHAGQDSKQSLSMKFDDDSAEEQTPSGDISKCFENELTPMSKLLSIGTQAENSKLRMPSLPIEDSMDLYGSESQTSDSFQKFPSSQCESQSMHFLVDDSQEAQMPSERFACPVGEAPKHLKRCLDLQDFSSTQETMDELLGLCSGKFTLLSENGDHHSASKHDSEEDDSMMRKTSVFGLSTQSGSSTQGNMDEFLGLCSGKFANSSEQKPRKNLKRKSGLQLDIEAADGEDDDDDDDNRSDVSFKFLSDAEDDGDMPAQMDEFASDKENMSDGEEGVDEERELLKKKQQTFTGLLQGTKKRKFRSDFVEAEAELSGSEFDSDENYDLADEDDIMEAEEGDKDIQMSEEALREQLGRVHTKSLLDRDDKQVAQLRELYLPDGDLHSENGGRLRRFRWNNVDDNTQEDMFGRESDDEHVDEEGGDEKQWRMARYEREKWKEEQLEKEANAGEESQILKLGKLFFKTKDSKEANKESSQSETNKPVKPKPIPLIKSGLRGSFLTRGKEALAKIAQKTKTLVNPNAPRNSKNFVFRAVSAEETGDGNSNAATDMSEKPKMQRSQSVPTAPKVPAAKRQKITNEPNTASVFSKNSIFNML